MPRIASALCAFFLLACGSSASPDSGAADAGPRADAGPVADAGTDAGEPPVVPDGYCPGSPGCDDTGDDVLYAGAAAIDITPDVDAADRLIDADGDGMYDPNAGDTFEDRNSNGRFDALWMAGFGSGRPASAVHDPQWARVLVLRQNETTIAFVSLDCVGWFLDDADPIRELAIDLEIDYIAVSATHVHEARDTIGIWGASFAESGRDADYMAYVQQQAADALTAAMADLRVAHVQYASLRLRDQPGGVTRYVSDSRDPYIVDDEVRIMRLSEDDGTTISTLVNYAAHPEYMGSRNTELSSDYVHFLRDGIENGADGPAGAHLDGVGGTTVFVNGALGAQIGPNRVQLQAWDGTPVPRGSLAAAQTMGSQVAYFVLQALGPSGGSVSEATADLGFRNYRFYVTIENRRYHIAYLQELFVRGVFNFDPDRPIRAGNLPDVLTEIAVIDVGRAQMIAIPGELDPSLFIGGYDGSYTPPDVEIVDTSQENPPDLTMAPGPPYVRDLARDDASQVWLLGLTNDFLGYLLPAYDYELDPSLPYLSEPPGDHYEETNSVGERAWPRIERKLTELLAWTP